MCLIARAPIQRRTGVATGTAQVMRGMVFCAALLALAGCSTSSGVLPYGPDTFTLSEHRGPVLGGAGAARTAAITEANAYCQKMGATFKPADGQEGGASLYGPTSYTLTFHCSTAISYKAAAQEAQAAAEECKNRRIAGALRTHVDSVNCSNPRIRTAWVAADYPFMDLIDQILAHRLVVAERIDRGEMTEAEGQADEATFSSGIVATAQQRTIAAAEAASSVRANDATASAAGVVANAASAEAQAARVNAWANLAATSAAIANPPRPTQVNVTVQPWNGRGPPPPP
jgi:hypothetical protein